MISGQWFQRKKSGPNIHKITDYSTDVQAQLLHLHKCTVFDPYCL